jgi:8-oxo-dGTP pyrophosphatase MutT (NUDIX family)
VAWLRATGRQLQGGKQPGPADSPPEHLCVYFALIDDASRSVLLIHHVKAQMWLLPGGHVDEGEDPRDTAKREALEERARQHRAGGRERHRVLPADLTSPATRYACRQLAARPGAASTSIRAQGD